MTVLFFFLILFLFVHQVLGSAFEIGSPEFVSSLPRGLASLTDSNFDELVFPSNAPNGTYNPWVIVFYAPWCGHCKRLIPQLVNFSMLANLEHVSIGLVNTAEGSLGKRFGIQKYPDVYYSTGRAAGRKVLYPFMNLVTPITLMDFSMKLLSVHSNTSVATGLTSLEEFSKAVQKSVSPLLLFVLPSDSEKDNEAGLEVIDAAASLNRNNLYAVKESTFSLIDEASNMTEEVSKVIKSIKQCIKDPMAKGPGGIVLLSTTNRFSTPDCFRSAHWLDAFSSAMGQSLKNFFSFNAYHAVERLSVMHWSNARSAEGYLGIVALREDSVSHDQNTKIITSIRQMIQRETSKDNPGSLLGKEQNDPYSPSNILWAYIDERDHFAWLARYGVAPEDVPDIVLVDVSRNRFFNLKSYYDSLLNDIDLVLKERDELEIIAIEKFAKGVLQGAYRASNTGFQEALAEKLGRFPGLSYLYKLLDYHSGLFLCCTATILSIVVGWPIMLFFLLSQLRKNTHTENTGSGEKDKKEK